jgi:hypothetical protein
MGKHVEFEDIEEMRRCVGIEDVELQKEIDELRVGDHVRLTIRTGSLYPGKTILVRITRIEGSAFRGRLAEDIVSPRLADLHIGSRLDFTTCHIHSLAKGRTTHGE